MKKIYILIVSILFIGCTDDNINTTTTQTPAIETSTIKTNIPDPIIVEEKKIEIATKTGSDIFQSCVACHGKNAEKMALGKSKVIQGWPAQKTNDVLNGYLNGTYGGAMQGLMKGQLSTLSQDDIKLVSAYISKL
ncbi:hypothetical protein N9A28_03670 [Sulfurimonas sp.]|nr:hypothetical protein [Sulfurimonas sp.]